LEAWDGTVKVALATDAWRRQMPRIFLAPRLPRVAGPAASVASACLEAGWQWLAPFVFRTRDGYTIDARHVCPRDIKAQYEYDVENKAWADWIPAHPELAAAGPRPLIGPIVAFGRGKPSPGKAMAMSQVLRGSLCQAGMFEEQRADDPWCKLCGERGTAHHRCWVCRGLKAQRDEAPPTMQHLGETASPDSPLYTRGLLADPAGEWDFVPYPALHETVNLDAERDIASDGHHPMSGLVAMDGSLKFKYRGGGALGWGLAACDAEGNGLCMQYGTVPCDLPAQVRILRAELFSLLMLLRVRVPPCTA